MRTGADTALDHPIPAGWEQDDRRQDVQHQRALPPMFLEYAATNEAGRQRDKQGILRCIGCSQPVEREDDPHKTVARVVRPNNSYGGAKAGELIYIEERELRGAVLECTMDLETYRDGVRKLAEPAEGPAKPRLLAMIEGSLEAFKQQTRAQIDAAKARLEAAAHKSVEEAAKMLGRQQQPAMDIEQSSQPRAPIADDHLAAAAVESANDRLRQAIADRRKLVAEAKELGIPIE